VSRSLHEVLLNEVGLLLEPVSGAAASQWGRRTLFGAIGWDLEAIPGFPVDRLNAAVAAVDGARRAALAAIANPPRSLDDFAQTLLAVANGVDAVREIAGILDQAGMSRPEQFEQLGRDLVSFLTTEYLSFYHPRLYTTLALLTLVEPAEAVPLSDAVRFGPEQALVRFPHRRDRLRLDRLPELLGDPAATLKAAYLGPNPLVTPGDARAVTDVLFPRLADWLTTMGVHALYGLKPGSGLDLGPAGNELAAGMLTVYKAFDLAAGVSAGAGATLALSPADLGDLGLVVSPFGDVTFTQTLGEWIFEARVAGSVDGFAVGRRGLTLATGGATGVAGRLVAAKAGVPGGAALVLGATDGTRLEVGRLLAALEASFSATAQDFGFLAEASSGALVVAAGDGDGFLQRVLPPEGLRTAFDLALGWSNRRGLYFRGGAGLETTFLIGQDLLGLLRVDSIFLALLPEGDAVRATVAATVSVTLGPVTAAVERFGLDALLSFPADGGNLGVADLALVFKPPSGAALAIDAGVVVGGGYLFFDPERGQYAGAVQLEIAEALSLAAFGLLTTRLPDGSPGFSLLVLIAVRFLPPVQLGYGFTLQGVGGILGVNRTVAVDAMRAGVRAGTLGSVLFPEDPVRNAPQIVSDLGALFPPAPGRFLFGPLVQLGWGTPTLLTLELGLILELPAPVRLIILGRLRVLLPHEQAPVVRLQLDVLGVIDFSSGDVALDATLYDSQVAQYAVSGDMALRANWGSDPTFLLAVGGFHPRYPAPAGFPLLERVAISLATGDNPRLRLEAYLALTSNTAQFGARLDLYAEAGPFSVSGFLTFDTLLQFEPFSLAVEITAEVALKFEGRSVMSVGLWLSLTGPTPWYVQGEAHFTFLFISRTVRFRARFGRAQPPPLPPPVRVWPLLLGALREAANWRTGAPAGEHPLVSFREVVAPDPAGGTLVHPLAALSVSQRVVPLGREIARFGNTQPDGERLFSVGVLDAGGTAHFPPEPGVQSVAEAFAPAQFRDLSDDEKLSAPAFESLPSGIGFAPQGYLGGPPVPVAATGYDRKTVLRRPAAPTGATGAARGPGGETDPLAGAARGVGERAAVGMETDGLVRYTKGAQVAPLSAAFVDRVAATGAAGAAPLAETGTAKYSAPRRAFGLRGPAFAAVVGRGAAATVLVPPGQTGGWEQDGSGALTYAAATEALQQRLAAHPEERPVLRVVPCLVAPRTPAAEGALS
jgi:hypothetical protein